MANATIKYGEGKWAIGENIALAYNDTNDRFKPLPFNFTRGSEATFVNRQGLIESTNTLGSEIADNNTISNDNGGVITKNSALNYSAVGDGTSVSIIRPIIKFNNFINGNRYKIVVTPTNQSGTIKFKLYDGSAYILLENDLSSEITEYFTKGTVDAFIAFDGTETFGVNFTISVKEVITTTNTPRIDFSNDEAGALLLEPQRTNEISNSSDFSATSWAKSNSTVVGGFISPDGGNNAYKLVENTSNATHSNTDAFTFSNEIYSFSSFVKADERSWVKLNIYDGTSSSYVYFDLTNGVVGQELGASGKIEEYGNGWYRCSVSTNSSTSVGNGNVSFRLADSDGGLAYLGDGTSGLYIYGAQLEEGSYATSYIPTIGTPNTRLGEVCNDAGNSSFINSEEGVLYAEISGLADDLTNRIISLSDGTTDNRVNILFTTSTNTIRAIVKSNGSNSFDEETVLSTLNYHKVALKYSLNNFSLWIDGVEISTDASGASPIGLNRLSFDVGNGNLLFYGKTSQVQVFSEALSDAELQTLTTI